MDEGGRLATAHDRVSVKVRGQAGQQTGRKVGPINGGRREIGRSPWADLQIPCVDLAWRSRQQNKNRIARAVQNESVALVSRRLREKFLRGQEKAGDSCTRHL